METRTSRRSSAIWRGRTKREAAPAPLPALAGPPNWGARRALPPMVTYAQNFEDVLLRRALPEIERGFYVDIGAFHPVVDSVTQWFYSQGWTGINVEPNPRFYALFGEHRPHDLNLPVAVSGQAGTLRLHLFDGLSTTVAGIADQHAKGGRQSDGAVEVETLSLGDLFERHAPDRTIDFLKIDVEGAEGAILDAYPFQTVRPRILVIEATDPDSIQLSSADWETGLLEKSYHFCHFDGLNRYYVRTEDLWRKALFDLPPNVFDHFLLPYTDRRVDYVGSARSVLGEAPDGGIAALLAERDRLRQERDDRERDVTVLMANLAAMVQDRDERARDVAALTINLASVVQERDGFALHVSTLWQERDNLMAQVAELVDARETGEAAAAMRIAEIEARATRLENERNSIADEHAHFRRRHPLIWVWFGVRARLRRAARRLQRAWL